MLEKQAYFCYNVSNKNDNGQSTDSARNMAKLEPSVVNLSDEQKEILAFRRLPHAEVALLLSTAKLKEDNTHDTSLYAIIDEVVKKTGEVVKIKVLY